MQNVMTRLLTVFMEPECNMQKATSRWLARYFNAIAAIGSIQSDTESEDRAECMI